MYVHSQSRLDLSQPSKSHVLKFATRVYLTLTWYSWLEAWLTLETDDSKGIEFFLLNSCIFLDIEKLHFAFETLLFTNLETC